MPRHRPSRNFGRLALGFALLALALAGTGCASAPPLMNVWKDPTFQSAPMSNVLVIALINDATRRRLWEDGIAVELAQHGVTAVQSYQLFPAAYPDTQEVITAVQEKGLDGVIASRRLPTDTVERYVPGYTTREPVTVRSPWTGAYHTYYRDVRQPGYTETETIVRYQTDVWTTKEGGRMVWSGTSQTFDPASIVEVNRETARAIVPELAKQGIVPPKRKK